MSRRARFVVASAVLLTVAGCSSQRVTECSQIAGPGWSPLPQPPANADLLLQIDNVPQDPRLVWLGKGRDQLLVCDYSSGLIIPGCSGSVAYAFEQRDGRWVSRGQLLDACNSVIEPK